MEYIRPFDTLTLDDIPLVGGKNASLGEMIRTLTPLGVRVPDGFALTADAYRALLDGPGVRDAAARRARAARPDATSTRCAPRGARARARACARRRFPPALLRRARGRLRRALAPLRRGGDATSPCARAPRPRTCRPRASPASRRPTSTSAAPRRCVDACRRCFASLFTDRAISYRAERGFDHEKVSLSVGVQKMVRSRSRPARA